MVGSYYEKFIGGYELKFLFFFCAEFLHIHTADMGYVWCPFENVIKIICQMWCRFLIT